jgi:hypothetical protein
MAATFILDSVTHLKPEHRGAAVYCASHGGAYAGYYAAKQGVGAVILNDAGVGRQQAGIGGLALLDSLGVPAAAISHMSARIGDGADGARRGVLSAVNTTATVAGLSVGMSCRDALGVLGARPPVPSPAPAGMAEVRFAIPHPGAIRVVGVDSISLVTDADAGQIVVCGSHGGLLGGRPETAIKVAALVAVYNDAGGGIDGAGVSRLPALEARGIAGACVSCFSARIGDARSTWAEGVISALNATAAARGGAVGQSCQDFVAAMTTMTTGAART